MFYQHLQDRIYLNKVRRNFNVTDVSKEIVLMMEEFGELCDAHLAQNQEEIVDALGDLMVYCLGLSAMFRWNADEMINIIPPPERVASLTDYFPYTGRELGRLAKTYKKSNKQPVDFIDRRDEFKVHLGNLMGYCSVMFRHVNADEKSILEEIVAKNETRKHQGQI